MRPYEENPRGHVWRKSGYGDGADIFAWSEGYHNGPECVACGYSFCEHCTKVPSHDCPVVQS